MSAFLNELLSHNIRARPTATELLKSHPLFATLVQCDSSPKISGSLPTQRLVTEIMTALADDDDVVSSLVPRVGSSKNESFSNQFEALTCQLGLEKNQVVSSSSVSVSVSERLSTFRTAHFMLPLCYVVGEGTSPDPDEHAADSSGVVASTVVAASDALVCRVHKLTTLK
jgi:hypothetical protein